MLGQKILRKTAVKWCYLKYGLQTGVGAPTVSGLL